VYFAASASETARIFVDGRPAEGRAILPGSHWLRVAWRGRTPMHVHGRSDPERIRLSVRWGASAEPGAPIPADALTPALGAWPGSRVALWWIAILGALAWGAGAFFAARGGKLTRLATVAIVLMAIAYRGYDYDVMPEFRENADELFATWNGWSLLEDGSTRGWSLWPYVYGGRVAIEDVRFFGEERPVISPYFEHPPLLHVIVGAVAHLSGAKHWLEAKLMYTRLVPIGLAAISIFLMAVAQPLSALARAVARGPLARGAPDVAIQERVIRRGAARPARARDDLGVPRVARRRKEDALARDRRDLRGPRADREGARARGSRDHDARRDGARAEGPSRP
jgi:hypothetical protein